jgi:hypothetical protein
LKKVVINAPDVGLVSVLNMNNRVRVCVLNELHAKNQDYLWSSINYLIYKNFYAEELGEHFDSVFQQYEDVLLNHYEGLMP